MEEASLFLHLILFFIALRSRWSCCHPHYIINSVSYYRSAHKLVYVSQNVVDSVHRMDKDQCARRNLREQDPTFHDPDYYEYESKYHWYVLPWNLTNKVTHGTGQTLS